MRKSLLITIALVPSLALASGYTLPNVNPRDLGVCASAVAAQTDAGAAFAMPAALARFSGPSVKLASGVLDMNETWKDPSGVAKDASIKFKFVPLPTAFVSYGGKLPMLGDRGWGVGAAFNTFGGGIVEWPEDWAGRFRIVKVDRRVIEGLLTAGIEVLPQVRIGGGLVYDYTYETFEQKFANALIGGSGEAVGTLKLSGGAVSYDVSAEIDPLPSIPLRIAVDYKHKATQTLKGDVKWAGVSGPGAPLVPIIHDQDAEEQLVIPNRLNIGVSYRVINPLLVMFTYTLDRWRVYGQDHFVGTVTGPTGSVATLTVPRKYRNGYTVRGGAEYDVMPSLKVRAGVQRDVSGLQTSTYSPTLPDASSWAGSLGATYRFARGVAVDLAVFWAKMDKVTSTNNSASEVPPAPGSFRGKYDINALIYGLGVSWTPGLVPAAQ